MCVHKNTTSSTLCFLKLCRFLPFNALWRHISFLWRQKLIGNVITSQNCLKPFDGKVFVFSLIYDVTVSFSPYMTSNSTSIIYDVTLTLTVWRHSCCWASPRAPDCFSVTSPRGYRSMTTSCPPSCMTTAADGCLTTTTTPSFSFVTSCWCRWGVFPSKFGRRVSGWRFFWRFCCKERSSTGWWWSWCSTSSRLLPKPVNCFN